MELFACQLAGVVDIRADGVVFGAYFSADTPPESFMAQHGYFVTAVYDLYGGGDDLDSWP